MLHYIDHHQTLPPLPAVQGLACREEDDPSVMAHFGNISIDEARRRLANDNKAYVAYYNGAPAAFGWLAMAKARIGELNHEFILPQNHRYLWNFRTADKFRGLGIYPRLLQHIVKMEGLHAEYFWILHAPENVASEKGIARAGFRPAGKVTVTKTGDVIFAAADKRFALEVSLQDSLGFVASESPQATCWKCSSPYIASNDEVCCCAAASKACNAELFR